MSFHDLFLMASFGRQWVHWDDGVAFLWTDLPSSCSLRFFSSCINSCVNIWYICFFVLRLHSTPLFFLCQSDKSFMVSFAYLEERTTLRFRVSLALFCGNLTFWFKNNSCCPVRWNPSPSQEMNNWILLLISNYWTFFCNKGNVRWDEVCISVMIGDPEKVMGEGGRVRRRTEKNKTENKKTYFVEAFGWNEGVVDFWEIERIAMMTAGEKRAGWAQRHWEDQ